jgi:hypothetical protein
LNKNERIVWALAAVPPFLKKLVFFAAPLVFFVVVSTEVGASSLINLQACCTNLITGKRTNCVFIAAFDATVYTLSYPTQTNHQSFTLTDK